MCRNIKTLYNFDPPASEEEIEASALQFVRKLTGYRVPSRANSAAFDTAVREVTDVVDRLFQSLSTDAAPRNREAEAAKRRARFESRNSR